MEKAEIVAIARKYYARDDIAQYMALYARNREVVAKYYDKFGKRPDTIEYANDIKSLAEKNATSFHCSVELWKDPLSLAKELREEQINELRLGWDLLLDIDCNFVDYSKEAAMLIVKALELHGIKNYGIKFSGNKGFHIVLSHEAFPKILPYKNKEITIKEFFPSGPRLIASYLSDFIEEKLREIILSMNSIEEIAKACQKQVKDLIVNDKFNPYSIISIDTILISNRHLYRMPYSLHEKTGLVSAVLNKQQLNAFNLIIAKPSAIIIRPFLKKPEEDEAKELLINAFDWQNKEKILLKQEDIKKFERKDNGLNLELEKEMITEDLYCDCIKKALEGIKLDGRKRALFLLLTYFRSLGFSFEKIEAIIREWNEKNYRQLKESYIKAQLEWFKKQTKKILPPNHSAAVYYKETGLLGEGCKLEKSPLTFTIKRLKEIKEKVKESKRKKGNKN
ncbi:MAG: DNA primase small subunit domain-containing protein [Candidatus Pacearchaeota archaeon]